MLHNAASLTFLSTGPNSEPWRSNLAGTRHVLELCRNARIRKFHHVSTAYCCGLRSGRIMETDLDVGQKMSNDYEQSKLQAEKMVRSADCLDSLTVHRPAIIIGDSTSGYTTTYHGFYALLQAVATLAQQFSPDPTGHSGVDGHFGVSGRETKNLVPVDWVSAVMTHVISHPEHHGQTYHLTPMHPVPSRLLADIFEESVGFYGVKLQGAGMPMSGLTEYEQLFCELISVYNSYWKDDPTFDSTNTRRAAPHLPCPHVDRKLLLRMAEYAIRVKFSSPRAKPDRAAASTSLRRWNRSSKPRRSNRPPSWARSSACGSRDTAAETGRSSSATAKSWPPTWGSAPVAWRSSNATSKFASRWPAVRRLSTRPSPKAVCSSPATRGCDRISHGCFFNFLKSTSLASWRRTKH